MAVSSESCKVDDLRLCAEVIGGVFELVREVRALEHSVSRVNSVELGG